MNPRVIPLPNGLTVSGLSKTDTLIVYKEIFEERGYQRHGLTYQEGDIIFDVGANTGLFAIHLNQICPRVKYFAFEPIPAAFAALRENVEQRTKLSAKLFNIGLSARAGEAKFTYYPRLSCASSMYPDTSPEEARRGREYILLQMRHQPSLISWPLALVSRPIKNFIAERVRRHYRKEETMTCPLRAVSDIIRECSLDRIDLLKVDAERAEGDILNGIAAEHWPRIRQAVVEVHEEADLPGIENILRQQGFRVIIERHHTFTNISMVYCIRPSA